MDIESHSRGRALGKAQTRRSDARCPVYSRTGSESHPPRQCRRYIRVVMRRAKAQSAGATHGKVQGWRACVHGSSPPASISSRPRAPVHQTWSKSSFVRPRSSGLRSLSWTLALKIHDRDEWSAETFIVVISRPAASGLLASCACAGAAAFLSSLNPEASDPQKQECHGHHPQQAHDAGE
jgi:hypothetical protein